LPLPATKGAFLMAGGLAIVLSGGGSKGAFQVGVLDALIRERGINFESFVGVSTGSIQALGGAMDDMPALVAEWTKITGNKDIYEKRPFGALGAIFGADSLFDAEPLRKKLKNFAKPAKLTASGKQLRVGTVNLQSGQYVEFDQNDAEIGEKVYASCAQPPFFQPLKKKNTAGKTEQWVDGGVRNPTPLSSGMKLKPRAILVVVCDPLGAFNATTKKYDNLVDIGLRSVGIQTSESARSDIENAELINDLLIARDAQIVKLQSLGLNAAQVSAAMKPLNDELARYSFIPVKIMAPDPSFNVGETMEFNPTRIKAAIELGRKAVNDDWGDLKGFFGV
jgi:NTE family protein